MKADVVIVGAGVAGLFTAYKLKKQGFRGTITIVEQGLSMKERLALRAARPDTLRGVGGPGLFSDGKICLSEKAGTRLTEFIDSHTLKSHVDYTLEILQELLPEVELVPSLTDKEALTVLKSKLQMVGLEMSLSYPVIHLGTDHVCQLALSFERFLKDQEVNLLTSTTAQQIKLRTDNTIEIKFRDGANDTSIQCQYLIAAVGKSGHDWLCKQLEHLDIRLEPNIPDLGIRLEFPNTVTQQLLSTVLNPRIEMKWNDTSIKTHCWCYGGSISTYDYLGSTIVDGETFKSSLTPYTSVNLLYHFTSDFDPVKNARKLLQEISSSSHGCPLVQSLGALRGDRQIYPPLDGNTSSEIFQEAQLERLFPEVIIEGFLEFIRRMDATWPGIADGTTRIYAPVLEWDTYRLPVDKHLRLLPGNACTSTPNIYVVGDGAGLSQGVVTAATCGLIAAEHLLQSYPSTYPSKQPENDKTLKTTVLA